MKIELRRFKLKKPATAQKNMELDFQTVKALSSPTRVNILREVLENEATPTQLSDELGKSKSTVSSHLNKLTEAELLEKDSVEGRKRVTYRPTRKAQAIVEGRERKVKFSIASSAVTTFAGIASLGYWGFLNMGMKAASADSAELSAKSGYAATNGGDGGGQMGVMSQGAEAAAKNGSKVVEDAARTAASPEAFAPETAFLYIGLGLLSVAATSFLYGWLIRKLG
jgi:DNA-binding transcriptional ArsR family regulator